MTLSNTTQRKNQAQQKPNHTTVNYASCHSLSRLFVIFLFLAILVGVSWPLIAQPVIRYVSLLVENIRNEEMRIAKEVKMAIQLPSVGLYLAVGLSGISVLLLIAGAIYTSTESWKAYNNIDDIDMDADDDE